MKFYNELLKDFLDLLKELNTSYIQEYNKLLFQNLDILFDTIKDSSISKDTICYSVAPLQILLPESLSHTIPNDVNAMTLLLSLRNIKIINSKNKIINPIDRLESFNIVIQGENDEGGEFISAWHLDKREESNSYNFSEPIFHFTFGGYKMENKHKDSNWDYGQLLLMRTPRIMHPPLDIILGIDFVLNQYVSKEYSTLFISNKRYIDIVSQIKDLIWKPYAVAFAKKMHNDFSKIDGLNFDDQFVNSITG